MRVPCQTCPLREINAVRYSFRFRQHQYQEMDCSGSSSGVENVVMHAGEVSTFPVNLFRSSSIICTKNQLATEPEGHGLSNLVRLQDSLLVQLISVFKHALLSFSVLINGPKCDSNVTRK